MIDAATPKTEQTATIGLEEAELKVLKCEFSTSDNSYRLALRSDGSGEIFYSDFPGDVEEFDYDLSFNEISVEIENACKKETENTELEPAEIETIHREITSEMLAAIFWEKINPTLDDPFFRSSYEDIEGEEFQTTNGSIEEFTDFLKLCMLTEREIKDADDHLIVEAETDIDPAGINDNCCHTERLTELVRIGCEYFQPVGYYYDYNDGLPDRMSGYCLTADYISLSFAEFASIPSREKMLGMVELRKKLAGMNVPAERIVKLTSF